MVPTFPQLAWVADLDRDRDQLMLRHGAKVEVRGTFWIEGVWAGPFAKGEFGQTECVFGSGGVLLKDGIRFVSSASTCDSLFYAVRHRHVTVSNSLPVLLGTIKDRLDPQCLTYPERCDSILDGIEDYEKILPTLGGHVLRLLYQNLDVSQAGLQIVEKPLPPRFLSFKDYRNYLHDTYALLAANARDTNRRTPMQMYSTQSKGYDTTACNAIAVRSGLENVFTIQHAKSERHLAHHQVELPDDDGTALCEQLGLRAVALDRRAVQHSTGEDEALLYCGLHHNQDANLLDMQRHLQAPSVLLTGINGDVVWSRRDKAAKTGLDSCIRRGDLGGHGMGEWRLVVGFVQIPLPFLGARRKEDLVAITESQEMEPWRLGTGYDRPIPRRIAEEAGVPRWMFGQAKMASAVIVCPPSIPSSPQLREAFFAYLVDWGLVSRLVLPWWPVVRWINSLLMLASERRYPLVHLFKRVARRLLKRPVPLLWARLNGALYVYCVNQHAERYS
jgi:hypothetical protein